MPWLAWNFGTCYIARIGLGLMVSPLSLPPEYWDDRCVTQLNSVSDSGFLNYKSNIYLQALGKCIKNSRGWRDGPAIKSTCSGKGHGYDFQDPHGGSHYQHLQFERKASDISAGLAN